MAKLCSLYKGVRMQYVFKINKLRMMPVNTAVFLRSFMTMLEKQILARAVGIQKENWG